ncbi:MAG: hypothetical protein HYZ17_14990 [Betaproteobacteria bacterium]|nr:hypothetical protein [Betaproteobacteria bacterium]
MTTEGVKERFREHLLARYSLRLHVSLLLAATVAVGIVAARVLLWLGLESMLLRYPLTLLLAYGAFFLFVRLWLSQVVSLREHGQQLREERGREAPDVDLSLLDGWGGGGGSGTGVGGLQGGGGQFGGGGASASFAGDGAMPTPMLSSSSSGGKGGSLLSGLDFDADDAWPLVLAVIILVAVVGGVFAYVIYAGPGVLVDAAFEAALAGGLVRAGRATARGDWIGSILRATWIPVALVFAATLGFAWMAAIYVPGAHTFGQVLLHLLTHG